MKKKIFITGARGFIASHLCNYLSNKGHDVRGIDNNSNPSQNLLNKNVLIEYGDVRYDLDIDEGIKWADLVYHLAAQINVDKSIFYPQETIDINFLGTVNVLNACKRYNKPMVFASTSEVYGGDGVQDEGSPTYAQSPYAVAKLAADKICGNYHDLYGVEVYRFRGFNTYGPYQSEREYGAVIPIFVDRVLHEKSPIIYGDGEQKRDFIHVDDIVKAYEMLPNIKELAGEPVNVGSGESISINSLAELIMKIVGVSYEIKHIGERPGEVRKLEADIKLFRSHGFEPSVKFEDGLKQYISWYKQKLSQK